MSAIKYQVNKYRINSEKIEVKFFYCNIKLKHERLSEVLVQNFNDIFSIEKLNKKIGSKQ